MESILARALEYTLKYWLNTFSRDQFKLQGRTAQLSNLDINGDALHASLGLPPALTVTTAKVGKLEITLPSVSNVQIEPIVVQIDRLDVVLEERDDLDASRCSSSNAQSTASYGKGNGYGFADKIADGMTLEVRTVNLLLETHGGASRRGGSTWISPMAAITIRNLLLHTTNENWQIVNLKEARDFSSDKKFIYVFKKLEWEYLSIDLLPHPDMFADANLGSSQERSNRKDDDGAKRVFFGGERFIEGISGEAYITIQRTELNSPLGLEVQLHISEVVCPALSEPGLRALLRFLTGLYVCLNRGDVNPNGQKNSVEAAGRSLVSLAVDHIFLCIKDTEFQLELLMQSLLFSRASVSDGENAKYLTQILIGGLFLRDTFSRPPSTLVQPSMQAATNDILYIPDFAKNFCPPIYPLGDQLWKLNDGVPLVCLHSLQLKPSPTPPHFTSETVISCQPLMIHLQEESCLRICSFLADGIAVSPGDVLPDFSINSLVFNLKGLDITVPLDLETPNYPATNHKVALHSSFSGARLHIEDLYITESPSLKLRLLNLEKDPACFCLWEDQPIDASQKKWTAGASRMSLSLETCEDSNIVQSSHNWSSGLWNCVELKGVCIEVAMATADGSLLINIPPPGGIVRVGVACRQYVSNTSVEQLFFVLDLCTYFANVSEKIAIMGKNNRQKEISDEYAVEGVMEKVPGDSAVSVDVEDLQLRFLESSSENQGVPLVLFVGEGLFIKVAHRTLGGAIAISSTLCWHSGEVDCADTERNLARENNMLLTSTENSFLAGNGYRQLRPVFWVKNRKSHELNVKAVSVPFLKVSMVHVIPYNAQDTECHSLRVSACIAGMRLGGGMNYAEALLHRFGILGPDGGPGVGLSEGLEHLSAGPLSKLFQASPMIVDELKESVNPSDGSSEDGRNSSFFHLGPPDDVDVSIELKDWLFALEGAQEMAERWWFCDSGDFDREERCWHTNFQSLHVKAKSSSKILINGKGTAHKTQKYPIELIKVGVEGLQIIKPQTCKGTSQNGIPTKGLRQNVERSSGINIDVDVVVSENDANDGTANWLVENLKFSVKQPIEAVVTKDELQHLALLCKSEVDSMGSIVAGLLRVLKLEGSIGQEAINQLSNLGSEGFDKIFNPKKPSDVPSVGISPSNVNGEILNPSLESTMASIEEMILDSKVKCGDLTAGLGDSSKPHIDDIKQLEQKLESMQRLLKQLRTQI